jgi:hypothetical protein
LFNVGQWYGPGVDVEGSVGDLLGQRGQFGEDFASGDGALPAADDREVGGAERPEGAELAGRLSTHIARTLSPMTASSLPRAAPAANPPGTDAQS